ncbi:hypothetical protein DFH27DRAFT_72119 [Peziza echinospora]|nr:hypothetical protein DFH27DRAFT_72119 [Peziza echinospora]
MSMCGRNTGTTRELQTYNHCHNINRNLSKLSTCSLQSIIFFFFSFLLLYSSTSRENNIHQSPNMLYRFLATPQQDRSINSHIYMSTYVHFKASLHPQSPGPPLENIATVVPVHFQVPPIMINHNLYHEIQSIPIHIYIRNQNPTQPNPSNPVHPTFAKEKGKKKEKKKRNL